MQATGGLGHHFGQQPRKLVSRLDCAQPNGGRKGWIALFWSTTRISSLKDKSAPHNVRGCSLAPSEKNNPSTFRGGSTLRNFWPKLAEGRTIQRAFLVGSRPPPNDDVWKMAKNGGFEVKTYDRDARNKEKAVDTELVAQGTLTIATAPAPGVLVIASGDRDFIPLVNVAHDLKWTVEMAAFSSLHSRWRDGAEC
jgi:uncharacterized LabA/DUF88 family protein